jgi:hypothetical protein
LAPPFVAVAVKITGVPAHIAPEGDDVILTEAIEFGVIAITIGLDTAVTPEAQGELDVIIHFTVSLLTKAELVKTGELVPAFIPFTSH